MQISLIKPRWIIVSAAVLLMGCFWLPSQAQAQAVTVDLDFQTGFSNGTTVINVGDTVRWTWVDFAPHSVVSIGGEFTSSEVFAGFGTTYEVTFADAGEFPYLCGVHGSSMGGTISVVDSAPVPLLSPTLLFGLPPILGVVAIACMRRRAQGAGSA
jgi:plastocyanin